MCCVCTYKICCITSDMEGKALSFCYCFLCGANMFVLAMLAIVYVRL